MDVDFEDETLRRLEVDRDFAGGHDQAIVKAFRKRMQFIRSAPDERDFYAMRSLHFKQRQGDREGQYSMRLNDQWRLIVKLERREVGKVVVVVSIVDYH